MKLKQVKQYKDTRSLNRIYLEEVLRKKEKFTYAEILQAYLDCRKRKRNTVQAKRFEVKYEENLKELLNEINSGTYEIGSAYVFAISDPKPREIWAATFRDRIVHHLIYNQLRPYFEKIFINDTYSCIRGRGTLAAVKQASKYMCLASNGFADLENTYYAKIDIENFFMSIDKQKLWDIIKCYIGEISLLSKLVKQNIFYNPTKNYRIKKSKDTLLALSNVPKKKSLFYSQSDKFGLPIGNITSQFFSNIYLNALDKECKHNLKIKYYVRYVDDIVLYGKSKAIIKSWITKIVEFIKKARQLSIHTDKLVLSKIKSGLHFLGTVIYPFNIILPSLRLIKRALKVTTISQSSYLGLLKPYKSFKIRKKLENILKTLKEEFSPDKSQNIPIVNFDNTTLRALLELQLLSPKNYMISLCLNI